MMTVCFERFEECIDKHVLNASLFTNLTLILPASGKRWTLSSGFLLALLLQPKTERRTLLFDGFGENSTPASMTTCNLL